MSLNTQNIDRLIPLEGCRGIAAFIVVAHHFLLAFLPDRRETLIGHWYYIFVNGDAAVYFFFVLSGFVLCWAYFNTGDINKVKTAFFKRLPRLAGPVLVTTISSYLLFRFNFYSYEEASSLSHSKWLLGFGSIDFQPNTHPSLMEAVNQGLTTFITGDVSLNSNLWTMKPEFLGSLIVFLLGTFISLGLSFKNILAGFLLFSLWGFGLYKYSFPFIAGVFLSAFIVKHQPKLNLATAIFTLTTGLYLLGYTLPERDYSLFKYASQITVLTPGTSIILNAIGAGLIIFAIMCNRHLYAFLDNKFCRSVGILSFPLYLVHTLVICSFSSYLYVQLKQNSFSNPITIILIFSLTMIFSIAISLPLVWFEKIWLNFINHLVKKIGC